MQIQPLLHATYTYDHDTLCHEEALGLLSEDGSVFCVKYPLCENISRPLGYL